MSERDRKNYRSLKSDPVRHAALLERKRRQRAGRKDYERTRKANWRKKNAVKDAILRRAHRAVEWAIQRGELVRATVCSRCGKSGDIEAHHPDYSKVLEIVWLCQTCHSEEHSVVRVSKAEAHKI